jgi:hypothetical protein
MFRNHITFVVRSKNRYRGSLYGYQPVKTRRGRLEEAEKNRRTGQRFDRPPEVQLLDAVGEVDCPGALFWTVRYARELGVSS